MSAARPLVALVLTCAALSGCGGGEDPPVTPKQRVVLVELNTSDSQVAGELYRRLLDQAGYATSVDKASARENYLPRLIDGDVQVVADYVSSAASALAGGPSGSSDATVALATLARMAGHEGITVLRATEAEVGTQYVVTSALARTEGLRTLSDLGANRRPVSLATAPDCLPSRECTRGLEQVYGIRLDRVTPLEGDTLTALRGGAVQLAQVTSTDPALDSRDLVALEDDKGLLDAENLVPMANTAWLDRHPTARTAMDRLAGVLTTADLRALVTAVARDGRPAGEVVQEYLTREKLL
jgi:osmoprotectant transport system substrate-binding protein